MIAIPGSMIEMAASLEVGRVAPSRTDPVTIQGKRIVAWLSGACLVAATITICVIQGNGHSSAELAAGSVSETYENYLQGQAHTVAIRQPDNVSDMIRDSNLRASVKCGFGVHCHLHVRPLQVDKTSGAWLGMGRVHGLRELEASHGDPARPAKGPWEWSKDESRDEASHLSGQGKQDMIAASLLEHRLQDMHHERSARDYMVTAPTVAGLDPSRKAKSMGGSGATTPQSPQERVDALFVHKESNHGAKGVVADPDGNGSQNGKDPKVAKAEAAIKAKMAGILHAFTAAEDT